MLQPQNIIKTPFTHYYPPPKKKKNTCTPATKKTKQTNPRKVLFFFHFSNAIRVISGKVASKYVIQITDIYVSNSLCL